MPSRTLFLATGLVAGLLALAHSPSVAAAKVYQWKDAQGVSHFSDSPPPPEAGAKNRQFKDGPTAAAAEPKPAEDPACTRARNNITQLKSDQAVGIDADGDGKSDRPLTPDERAEQIRQNEASLSALCGKPAGQP